MSRSIDIAESMASFSKEAPALTDLVFRLCDAERGRGKNIAAALGQNTRIRSLSLEVNGSLILPVRYFVTYESPPIHWL